jgi:nitroreductase
MPIDRRTRVDEDVMVPVLHRRVVLAAAALALTPALVRARGATPTGLDQLLGRRRMVRRFTDAPVDDATVNRLLRAAGRAPSAGNTQPWAFVVVRDEEKRRALAHAALDQSFVAAAPVAIVAAADARRARERYGARAERYALIDTAFASLCLLLAVTEERLGACFVGAFDDAAVARIVGLPDGVRPLAVIPVGHPAERPRAARLRPAADIVHRERWGGRNGTPESITID